MNERRISQTDEDKYLLKELNYSNAFYLKLDAHAQFFLFCLIQFVLPHKFLRILFF